MVLKELLEAVRAGERSFSPASQSPEDMEAFQPIAKAFAFAAEEGYLDKPLLHRESQSGNSWYDLAVAQNGLSFKGERFLTSPDPTIEARLEEVVELRPNFCGIGINLRAAWRAYFEKRGR